MRTDPAVIAARQELVRVVPCLPAARLPRRLRQTRAQVEAALDTGALLAVPADPAVDAWRPGDGLEAALVPEEAV